MDGDEFIRRIGKHFKCELCGNMLATNQCVEDHINGKKHRHLVNLKITREEQSKRSVFVGNLMKTNSEVEIMEHFNKFGALSRVIMDKEKSAYAIIEFAEEESAAKAVEDEKQIMNGHHIVVRPREVREFVPRSLVQRKTYLEDKMKREEIQTKEMEMLAQKLVERETIGEQLITLSESTHLSPSSLQIRYLICNLLQEVLSEFFANCRVFPYGSTVNGCGGETSDLDIFLSLNWKEESWKYQFASLKQGEGSSIQGASGTEGISDEDTSQSIRDNESEMKEEDEESLDPDNMPEIECLNFVAKIIQKCVPSCHKVQTIASARKPLVKFIHRKSGLHCDITLNNRLSLRNTELIHFYCTLHPLIGPMIHQIRMWAKLCHISEISGPGPKLTNYAVTWMVILFLQTKGIVPPVEELQKSAGPDENLTIDGWDCSLDLDSSKYRTGTATLEPGSLLQAFYDFYSNLDWTVNCLCPFEGKVLPLEMMTDVLHPCDSGDRFKTGPLNIQDPLELTHNIASNVNEKTMKVLLQEFQKAALLCKSASFVKKTKNVVDGDSSPLWGASLLLGFKSQTNSKQKNMEEGNYCLTVDMKSVPLTEQLLNTNGNPEEHKVAWAEKVTHLLLTVLEDTLKVSCVEEKCEPSEAIAMETSETSSMDVDEASEGGQKNSDLSDGEPPEKRQRVSSRSEASNIVENESERSTVGLPLRYSCSLKHNIWIGRRKIRRSFQKSGTSSTKLSLERLVTEKLIQQTVHDTHEGEAGTEFHLVLTKSLKENAQVQLSMTPLKGEAVFKQFYHFLDSFLTNVLV